jgi:hypothetical protein
MAKVLYTFEIYEPVRREAVTSPIVMPEERMCDGVAADYLRQKAAELHNELCDNIGDIKSRYDFYAKPFLNGVCEVYLGEKLVAKAQRVSRGKGKTKESQ